MKTKAKPAPLVDVSERQHKMPRDAALLFPQPPGEDDHPHFVGLVRFAGGAKYWIRAWPRTCGGKVVLEIRLTEKRHEEKAAQPQQTPEATEAAT